VIPSWCATFPDCWAAIVDKWLDVDWQKAHQEKSEHRMMMPGVPHHQGSASLSKYKKAYVSLHHLSNLAALNSA